MDYADGNPIWPEPFSGKPKADDASRGSTEATHYQRGIGSLISEVSRIAVLLALIGFACVAEHAVSRVGTTQAVAAESNVTAEPPLPNLQLIRELRTPGPISAVFWSSDGAKLAASSIGQAAVVPIIPPMRLPNPFGTLVTIWDSDGHTRQQIQPGTAFFTYDDTFAFVANDKQIATPPVHDTSALALFDVNTGQIVREIPGLHPGRPRNVNGAKVLVASPDQSVLAVIFGRALEQKAALYSTLDWNKLVDLPNGPRNQIKRPEIAAFSADSKLLATGEPSRYVSIYDLTSGRMIREIDAFPDRLIGTSAIAFSPDGRMIALGSKGTRGVNRRSDGRIEFGPPNNSPVRIFRVTDGVLVAAYGAPPAISSGLIWSPDARFIAFITDRRILHFWNPFQTESPERTIELSGARESGPIALSPDGTILAVGVDQNVRLYQVTR